MRTDADIWVGLHVEPSYRSRLVVFDPALQEPGSEHVLLYYVEGHTLCRLQKEAIRPKLKTCRRSIEFSTALAQYSKWRELVGDQPVDTFVSSKLPVPGKRCPDCNGEGRWGYAPEPVQWGDHSSDPAQEHRCKTCSGTGSIDDLLEV